MNEYFKSNWNLPVEKEVIVDSSMKPSDQSAVTVAEANTQVYKNGIENDQYYAVEIHGPVLFEMLFGCDHLYARKYSQRSFWCGCGQGGEKETGEKKGLVVNAYDVWMRECKLDASYLYFIPVERVANLKMTRGNAIYIIYDNSTWLPEDTGKNLNRFHQKFEAV